MSYIVTTSDLTDHLSHKIPLLKEMISKSEILTKNIADLINTISISINGSKIYTKPDIVKKCILNFSTIEVDGKKYTYPKEQIEANAKSLILRNQLFKRLFGSRPIPGYIIPIKLFNVHDGIVTFAVHDVAIKLKVDDILFGSLNFITINVIENKVIARFYQKISFKHFCKPLNIFEIVKLETSSGNFIREGKIFRYHLMIENPLETVNEKSIYDEIIEKIDNVRRLKRTILNRMGDNIKWTKETLEKTKDRIIRELSRDINPFLLSETSVTLDEISWYVKELRDIYLRYIENDIVNPREIQRWKNEAVFNKCFLDRNHGYLILDPIGTIAYDRLKDIDEGYLLNVRIFKNETKITKNLNVVLTFIDNDELLSTTDEMGMRQINVNKYGSVVNQQYRLFPFNLNLDRGKTIKKYNKIRN